ncbi:hypothetical protein K439DRAFT_1615582 [Ramaria rubella]|nr:hypothetical protein K439DRAFT_1615582 [Ramaria rubella]
MSRAQIGDCTLADIEKMQLMDLTNPKCVVPNFKTLPWSNVLLVTPRHAVRDKWNEASVCKHCAVSCITLFIAPYEDTKGHDREPLTMLNQFLVAKKKTQDITLPRKTLIAQGMHAMVTWNVAVHVDLAKGTQGTVNDLLLNPRKPPVPLNVAVHKLQHLPSIILFKPDFCPISQLPCLSEGIMPL